jgi:predicted O-linked N-acetylglucosamine transferase (SPINDLY family)
MFPGATAIAGLRLAPVQCLAAAHPETSGLPTIDYFLSAVLMEPPDGAQSYYTESLVLLPNTGMAYSKPGGALPGRTRAMVGLREDATVYLCCQSIFKYLPQHDGLLVDIARRVPGSQFVFVAGHPAGGLLERRVRWAFESAGVGGEDTLCFLPRQRESEFLELMSLSDVYLDSVDWNGMNTTHQAVAAGLPIVTWPRGAMRGRHSFAILTMLGVTETIAGSGSEYVSIAVRLGLDRDFRRDVSSRLLAGQSKLFDDVECVRALEGWYEEVARGGAGGEGR